jgi:hypothetical protein
MKNGNLITLATLGLMPVIKTVAKKNFGSKSKVRHVFTPTEVESALISEAESVEIVTVKQEHFDYFDNLDWSIFPNLRRINFVGGLKEGTVIYQQKPVELWNLIKHAVGKTLDLTFVRLRVSDYKKILESSIPQKVSFEACYVMDFDFKGMTFGQNLGLLRIKLSKPRQFGVGRMLRINEETAYAYDNSRTFKDLPAWYVSKDLFVSNVGDIRIDVESGVTLDNNIYIGDGIGAVTISSVLNMDFPTISGGRMLSGLRITQLLDNNGETNAVSVIKMFQMSKGLQGEMSKNALFSAIKRWNTLSKKINTRNNIRSF